MNAANRKGKILAINFGGIGDEILFLPTLRTIRNYYPDWSMTLLLEPRSRSFSELTNLVDTTITFDIKKKPLLPSDLLELLSLIKNGGFDIIVSSGSSIMVSLLLFLSGARTRIGYNSNALAPILLTEAVPLNRKVYAGEMYHSLAEGMVSILPENEPVKNDNGALYHPRIETNKNSLANMDEFLKVHNIDPGQNRDYKLVLIHPGTSKLATVKGIFKTWSAKNWSSLIESIQKESFQKPVKIVLAGGPDDKEIIEEIEQETRGLNIVSAFGATKNLNDLAALISFSDLFICVDSAPMHVGVALEKPLVALFGPTDPNLLLPDDERFKFVWDNDGNRHMFDRKGVNLGTEVVFEAVKKKLS